MPLIDGGDRDASTQFLSFYLPLSFRDAAAAATDLISEAYHIRRRLGGVM